MSRPLVTIAALDLGLQQTVHSVMPQAQNTITADAVQTQEG